MQAAPARAQGVRPCAVPRRPAVLQGVVWRAMWNVHGKTFVHTAIIKVR